MKVTARLLESLLASPSGAITTSLKQLSDLSKHSQSCLIDDWEAFINLLHDKRLSYPSEVVAVSILGASILDNAFVDSLEGTSDSKTVLNLLNVLSFKLKSPNDFARKLLSLSYATIYCYLAKFIAPHLQDFNDLHKKIKQRIEEDAKHLVKLLEYCFSASTLALSRSSADSFTPLLTQFLNELSQLVTSQSNVFKNQARFLENILLSALELRENSTTVTHQLIEEPLLSSISQLLGSLPRCTSTAAGYPDRVKYFANKYMNNLQYIFLFFARGVKTQAIFTTSFAFEDSFSTTPAALLFDFKAISEAKRASPKAITDALIERISAISNLLEELFAQIRGDSVHCWNIGGYFKMIETILNLDAKYLAATASSTSSFDEGLLETDKVVLPRDEYIRVSVAAKVAALRVLRCLCEVIGQGLTKHVEWVYDALYFVSVNFENNSSITAELFTTVSEVLQQTGTLAFEFTEYLLFQSPIKPLSLVLDHFTSISCASSANKDSTSTKALLRSILNCLKMYLQTCGRLQTKPELIGEVDAVLSAAISSNLSRFLEKELAEPLIDCVQSALFANQLKFEESLLLSEITVFLNKLEQSSTNLKEKAASLRRVVFFICQAKKTSFIDGPQDLMSFAAARITAAAEQTANRETDAEDDITKYHRNQSNIQDDDDDTWGGQQKSLATNDKFSLKRTFTELINIDDSSNHDTDNFSVALSKKLKAESDQNEDQLILNPILDDSD